MTLSRPADAAVGTQGASRDIAALEEMARHIRVLVIRTVTEVGVGHVGGPLSAVDILAALYGRILRVRPEQPDWPDRDRFVLSKGHSSARPVCRDGAGRVTSPSRR